MFTSVIAAIAAGTCSFALPSESDTIQLTYKTPSSQYVDAIKAADRAGVASFDRGSSNDDMGGSLPGRSFLGLLALQVDDKDAGERVRTKLSRESKKVLREFRESGIASIEPGDTFTLEGVSTYSRHGSKRKFPFTHDVTAQNCTTFAVGGEDMSVIPFRVVTTVKGNQDASQTQIVYVSTELGWPLRYTVNGYDAAKVISID